MSDPALPPFTQKPFTLPAPSQLTQAPVNVPGIHYDAAGNPWFCDASGNWQPPKQAPVPQVSSSMAQSAAQGASSNFPSTLSGPPHMSSSNTVYPTLIDPRLLPPLPDNNDFDLTNPHTITKARLGNPAPKVEGARRKGKDPKGKKRQHSSDSDNGTSDGERAPKRGRRKGSSKFSKEDVTKLLDLVETHLPLGQKGWKAVQSAFSKWASGLGHPVKQCT
ncbi:hypothetical protein DFH08DRAFT_961642 [Mycena albidolilacea]|uniref:Uncharacterized protein n=1 Tax=Mycena albidolilacea TaxID=1033008 RepID=A0AAD6ZZX7_9AGAR|nr:hypothetical protein DFH08DRAFT_961642 [Mycena albidolilacea]